MRANFIRTQLRKIWFLAWFSFTILSLKTSRLRSIGLWWIGGGGRENTKIRFGVIEDYYDHYWPYQIFIFIPLPFPSETKNHLFSSISTKINQIWEISSDWWQIWYAKVEMTSSRNSILPKLGRGDAERLESQKLFFFEPVNRESKVISSRFIRRGAVKVFLIFYLEKWLFLTELPYINIARKLKFGIHI